MIEVTLSDPIMGSIEPAKWAEEMSHWTARQSGRTTLTAAISLMARSGRLMNRDFMVVRPAIIVLRACKMARPFIGAIDFQIENNITTAV